MPNYVAKKSAWSVISFWSVLFFFLIVPLIVMIIKIIIAKHEIIEFYDDYIVEKSGVLARREKRMVFQGVVYTSISQRFWQRVFGYGDISIRSIGRLCINAKGIARPVDLKEFLEKHYLKTEDVAKVLAN